MILLTKKDTNKHAAFKLRDMFMPLFNDLKDSQRLYADCFFGVTFDFPE